MSLYSCMASNVVGNRSVTVFLNITHAPVTLSSSRNISIKVEKPFTLDCSSDANPMPFTHIWKKDNVTLETENSTKIDVLESKASDSGRYECTPVNSIGTGRTV